MAIGEVGEVEGLPLANLLLDGDGGAFGIDRDDGGGGAVEAPRPIMVAGELEAVAFTKLLLHFDERFGLVAP